MNCADLQLPMRLQIHSKVRALVHLVFLVPIVAALCAAAIPLGLSSSFTNGAIIPKQYTGDGADQSPPLRWTKPPDNAKSIAIVLSDPDAPHGTWYHWFLYNLSAHATSLDGGIAKSATISGGAMQGTNDFNKVGYNGPAPPPGSKHRYYFRVLALDAMLPLKPSARKDEFNAAIRGHIVGEGYLLGIYSR